MQASNKRKSFLIISPTKERLDTLTQWINIHYSNPTVYTAPSGSIAYQKFINAPVEIIVADIELRSDSIQVLETILGLNVVPNLAIILVGNPPEEEKFIDEIVSGQVQFLASTVTEIEFSHSLVTSLNFNSQSTPATFRLLFLAQGDLLIKEGEKAEFIYILKNGELQAYHLKDNEKMILGKVGVGEFVGEMALINNEPRSAYIEAIKDSELIELPVGLVNKMIYCRPAWAKALMQTLSKRLKSANQVANTKT